jgi:crotonobetainyl-CoA:carnitine CoA-transferase CaiB-like acyl-CoA transferase
VVASPEPEPEPLAGVKVVDLTAFWAGPTASHLLASLGADVIKVESIQRPDGMRFSSSRPASEPDWWEFGAHYQTVNTNKRGITLDLGSARGLELLFGLLSEADVLIENFSPRVLDNFGLTWETVHERAPSVVMVRMPAFGLTGPWRNRTGFAQTMEQATGLAWMTGYRGGDPIIPKGICDPNAGVHAAFAVLAALARRGASGTGCLVECPMVEAALSIAAEPVLEYAAGQVELARDGNRGPVSAPQGVYACRGTEKWLALAVATDAQWEGVCRVLGDPDWSGDVALRSAQGRRAAHDLLDECLSEWAAGAEVDDAVDRLVAAGVPAAKVVEPHEALDNPHLQARAFAEWVDHPVVGRHRVMGLPFRLASRRQGWITRPAPVLGQHNEEVLATMLGLAADDIEALRAAEVIGNRPKGM